MISCTTARNFFACLMHNRSVLELVKHFCTRQIGDFPNSKNVSGISKVPAHQMGSGNVGWHIFSFRHDLLRLS